MVSNVFAKNLGFPDEEYEDMAGYGAISNGVPRAIGKGGASAAEMPAPPKGSRRLGARDISQDNTVPNRRAR